ncbi:DUF3667 domain-containing protein [Belliella kenyensis]|uniref:DUF3667 domain-containing protein n=1 Tax=Belliella kenyensis TaxID=1472724 RepID=A0ABV8EH19_9BACT|nr:DUF3667 domain-containing protein [Belliella kenyensis]MCH7403089.1 DUF3667 domain-containing protein [Belliella kenyensis]MDN3602258.1 DUF3667 domain-containing protein [Belliella kenyensis]
MKKSRKLDHCLNCGESLLHEENFCPVCGQENKDQRVSIGIFISDFFSNYINFDSTFFRTLPKLLFKPGSLTLTFSEGKRKKYIHPIRLYLIFSLFYFFIFSLIIPKNMLDTFLSNDRFIDDDFISINEGNKKKNKLTEEEGLALAEEIETASKNPEESKSSKTKWKELKILAQDSDVSMAEFEQSLQESSWGIGNIISTEKQRAFIANSNLFISGVARNLPLMMFALLPIFAGILMLLYIRSDKYFVEHMVHALHLHTFAYLIYGLGILGITNLNFSSDWVVTITFTLVSVYSFLSFKNIYKQSWIKTMIKFFILGHIYITFLSLGLMTELYITLLLM